MLASDAADVLPQHHVLTNRQQLFSLATGQFHDSAVVTGVAVMGSGSATAQSGKPTILLRESLGPMDAAAIGESVGVVSTRGGASSHMVVLARGLGKAVATAVPGLSIDVPRGIARIGGAEVAEGEWLTLDGTSGHLYRGRGAIESRDDRASENIVRWARSARIPVLTNVDFASDISAGGLRCDGIGLCRSERHLSSADELALVDRALHGDHTDAVIEPLIGHLAQCLEELLRTLNGEPVHYRLLDPSELSPSSLRDPCSRGVRWGIISGFYAEQVRAVADTVKRIGASGCPVDIVVVAPFVGLVDEAVWVRDLVTAAFAGIEGGRVRVRIGCMIETPLGILHAAGIAGVSDVVCVGTNDLTELVWGVNRNDCSQLVLDYGARGFIERDPFQHLDMSGVGSLIGSLVATIKSEYPNVPVIMCGEHASIPQNAAFWAELGKPVFSVRRSSVAAVQVALFQAASNEHAAGDSRRWPISSQDSLSRDSLREMRRQMSMRQFERAGDQARAWAGDIAFLLGLAPPTNWKFFKRDVVAHWFGSNASRRFLPGWSAGEVLAFADSIRSNSEDVRFSLFPGLIACHALSEVLPRQRTPDEWLARLEQLDRTCALEVFRQQSPTKLCFRAILKEGRVQVEAGRGQAMYVFEQERGRHAILSGNLYPVVSEKAIPEDREDSLVGDFQDFLTRFGEPVAARLLAMQVKLGVEWLGIEGYYGPADPLVVCDLDLPADLAIDSLGTQR